MAYLYLYIYAYVYRHYSILPYFLGLLNILRSKVRSTRSLIRGCKAWPPSRPALLLPDQCVNMRPSKSDRHLPGPLLPRSSAQFHHASHAARRSLALFGRMLVDMSVGPAFSCPAPLTPREPVEPAHSSNPPLLPSRAATGEPRVSKSFLCHFSNRLPCRALPCPGGPGTETFLLSCLCCLLRAACCRLPPARPFSTVSLLAHPAHPAHPAPFLVSPTFFFFWLSFVLLLTFESLLLYLCLAHRHRAFGNGKNVLP